MKKTIIVFGLLLMAYAGFAQDEEEDRRFFKKENLFTGGSLSLSFFNNSFLIGVNPHLGYSLTRWADVGLVINYNYTSFRDYNYLNDKLRGRIERDGDNFKVVDTDLSFTRSEIEKQIEETPERFVIVHVASGVYMNESADAGDNKNHDGREGIDHERHIDFERAQIDPSV